MTVQTSFAKKVVRFQNTYDCFLAPLGNDGELDLALLDVKNRVRRIALPEHNFILSIIVNGSPAIYLREKHFGIERELYFAFHCWPSFAKGILWGNCECVAKGTVGKPDRQIGIEHERAVTGRLGEISSGLALHTAGSCALSDDVAHPPHRNAILLEATSVATRPVSLGDFVGNVHYHAMGCRLYHPYVLGR